MYMCKTRGLSTAIFNESLLSAFWRTPPPDKHLNPGGICDFYFEGRSHNLFMLEAVGEKTASYVTSALANTRMHTRQPGLFFCF